MTVYVKAEAEATKGKHAAKQTTCYCGTMHSSAYQQPKGGVRRTWNGEVRKPALFVELPEHQGIVVRFKGVRYAVIGHQLYALGAPLTPQDCRTVLREMREAVEVCQPSLRDEDLDMPPFIRERKTAPAATFDVSQVEAPAFLEEIEPMELDDEHRLKRTRAAERHQKAADEAWRHESPAVA